MSRLLPILAAIFAVAVGALCCLHASVAYGLLCVAAGLASMWAYSKSP